MKRAQKEHTLEMIDVSETRESNKKEFTRNYFIQLLKDIHSRKSSC